jgi:hypothetical protein
LPTIWPTRARLTPRNRDTTDWESKAFSSTARL